MPALHLATFACDVTPPIGHPLCGGWIEPVRGVDDPLRALGVVLLGAAHRSCCAPSIGAASATTPTWPGGRPWPRPPTPRRSASPCSACIRTTPRSPTPRPRNSSKPPTAPPSLDLKFFDKTCRARGRRGQGGADEDGRVHSRRHRTGKGRTSRLQPPHHRSGRQVRKPPATAPPRTPRIRAEPEGLIDPWLRTLSFWNGDKPAGRPALLRHASDELLRRRPGHAATSAAWPAKAPTRNQGVSGVLHRLRRQHHGRQVQRRQPRRTGRCCATACTTAMKAAWKATNRHADRAWEWRVEPVKLPPRAREVVRRRGEQESAGGRQGDQGQAGQRGLSTGVAEAAGPADRRDVPRPRQGAGAAPAGRAVHRVPARGAGAAQGPLRLRGRLRRRRPGLHSDRPGVSAKAATSRPSPWRRRARSSSNR